MPKDTVAPTVTKFAFGITATLADPKSLDIKTMPLTKIQWETVNTTQLGGPRDDGAH